MRIAVLGSGNGGCTLAADWSLAGHQVKIFDFRDFQSTINDINKAGGITVEGDIEGFAKVEYAGDDIEKTLKDADIVFAVGPAYSTASFAEEARDYIKPEQLYIVCPGSLGGALITKKVFSKNGALKDICIAETSTLPYATRLIGPATLEVYLKLKGGVMVSTIPSGKASDVVEVLSEIYPNLIKSDNVLQTMLQNGNPVIHPAVTILNTALIERTKGDFLFYEEGVTPAVGRLIKAVDEERMELGRRLGVEVISETGVSLMQGYLTEDSYEYGYTTAPGFMGIKAQSSLDYRYINEDVGYGLVFMKDLAEKVGLDVPAIDSIITIASIITGKDFLKIQERTLEKIGYSLDQIVNDDL